MRDGGRNRRMHGVMAQHFLHGLEFARARQSLPRRLRLDLLFGSEFGLTFHFTASCGWVLTGMAQPFGARGIGLFK